MSATPAPTAYDLVAYPAGIFASTHPDHLATIARLHGLSPPPIETARVLEVGGGDGVNLIAMAAAYPDAQFLSFDLAPSAVARGRAIAAAAGLENVRIKVANILDAAGSLPGEYDYVLVHGVYAWVPGPVRDAIMALIGRVLSPHGVAFVSYNALPGGHLRRIVREMALHHVAPIADRDERLAAGRAFLADFGIERESDRPVLAALRAVARPIAEKPAAALHHDELGELFEPQALEAVVAAAAAQGLRFLNEADHARLHDGFPAEPLDDAALVRQAQADDHQSVCFFRQSLFVRAETAVARTPSLDAIAGLYASAKCTRTAPTQFRADDGTFGISDLPLADAVAGLGGIWPRRRRVGDIVDGEQRLEAMYHLFVGGAVALHSAPLPGVAEPGAAPRASSLARALIARGHDTIFTLDHRAILFDDPGPRAFLALLDGSRDRAALERDWAASGFGAETGVDNALSRLAGAALLVA